MSTIFFNRTGQAGFARGRLTTGMVGFMETLRALARETREQRKIKLVYIAAASDRGESALSRWETGETECPDRLDQVIEAYASAFEMSAIELVEAVAQRMRDEEVGEAVEGEVPPPSDDPPTSGRRGGTRQPSRKSTATSQPRPRGRRSRVR